MDLGLWSGTDGISVGTDAGSGDAGELRGRNGREVLKQSSRDSKRKVNTTGERTKHKGTMSTVDTTRVTSA